MNALFNDSVESVFLNQPARVSAQADGVTSDVTNYIAGGGLFMTDTIETFHEPLPENAEIISVAPIFAEAIRSIHERTSVSQLFQQ